MPRLFRGLPLATLASGAAIAGLSSVTGSAFGSGGATWARGAAAARGIEPAGPAAPSSGKRFLGPAGTPNPWTPLTNQPNFRPGSMLLLTDGSVLVHEDDKGNWWRLTPSTTGSYVDGTWSRAATMPSGYTPEYFASAILPDGRMIVEGGEYNGGAKGVWTTDGAIYDPVSNSWTSVAPPAGWATIVDERRSDPDEAAGRRLRARSARLQPDQ